MREEFEAAYVEDMVRIMGEGIRKRAFDNTKFLMQNGEFQDPALRLALWAWKTSRESLPAAYTAVDLANASADGFRDGAASRDTEVEALRKDKDRLDALESNFWDVRHDSHPIADTGDSSSSLEIVGHWMDKPFERVIGEDYNENLRAAIDQAMKAPAYPPARPEYEFDAIPDFGGGGGNKARRRAEAMGIDYDAAMSKEG